MAPHWTLALLLAISILLGIGRASITNSYNDQPCRENHVCVPVDLCRTEIEYRSLGHCSNQLTCCKIEDSNNLSIQDPL